MRKEPLQFSVARRRRQAERLRQLQRTALRELYKRSHGREPSARELHDWALVAVSRPIDPFSILTPEQVAAALADLSSPKVRS